jgi:hypothetical protein
MTTMMVLREEEEEEITAECLKVSTLEAEGSYSDIFEPPPRLYGVTT